MEYKTVWLLGGRIIFNKLHDGVEPQHIHEVVTKNVRMMDTESQSDLIHIIYDMQDTNLSGDVVSFQKASRPMFTHISMGWLIVINNQENRVVNMMASMVSKIFSAQFRQFNSLEEGLKFLQTMDSSLPDLSKLEAPNGD